MVEGISTDYARALEWSSRWWRGENLNRPMLYLYKTCDNKPKRRDLEIDGIKYLVDTSHDIDIRVKLELEIFTKTKFYAEGIPFVRSSLGPNTLALFLGCSALEMEDSVWVNKVSKDIDDYDFMLDPDNPYWFFQIELIKRLKEKGDFYIDFPDFNEGIDILCAMRGTEEFLYDLVDSPDWVKSSLGKVTNQFIYCYDKIYDLVKDEHGGSLFQLWAPGKMAKLQCDPACLISSGMFDEFMLPELERLTTFLDYSYFHLDGPGALKHLDSVLGLAQLDVLQWTPGAGYETAEHSRWWPIYHKALSKGKKIFIKDIPGPACLADLKKEFGKDLSKFVIRLHLETDEDVDEVIESVSS